MKKTTFQVNGLYIMQLNYHIMTRIIRKISAQGYVYSPVFSTRQMDFNYILAFLPSPFLPKNISKTIS